MLISSHFISSDVKYEVHMKTGTCTKDFILIVPLWAIFTTIINVCFELEAK
jgi:hypothetical protein